jgi:hypothetical protein
MLLPSKTRVFNIISTAEADAIAAAIATASRGSQNRYCSMIILSYLTTYKEQYVFY